MALGRVLLGCRAHNAVYDKLTSGSLFEKWNRPRLTARSTWDIVSRMRIGIIGSGQMGKAFTFAFRAVGHDVALANSRGPESLADFASETGAEAVTVAQAAHGRDILVLAVPQKRIIDLPKDVFAAIPHSVPVIDTGNYYPRHRDGFIEEIENGMMDSAWVAQVLGHPVVKAFNNILAADILECAKPKSAPLRVALPVSSDDPQAKAVVMQLIDEIGFDPVDAGTIAESWRQQPGSPVYLMNYDAARLRRALSEADPELRLQMFRIHDEELRNRAIV